MTTLILRAALVAVLVYALLVLALFLAQRSLQYPVQTRQATAAEAGLADFRDIALATPDGERLVAWWKPPQPGRTLVLYLHGNASSLWGLRERMRALGATGRGVLVVAYRGYSGSTGSPTEEGLRHDARTAYEWARNGYEPSRIVLYGESLGSAVAVRLATERPVGGVILDGAFTSAAAVARLAYWYVPVSWLMRDQFRSVELIGGLKAPLLALHGDADATISLRFGEELFAAAPAPKQFVRLPGAGHGAVLENGGAAAAVEAFLAAVEARLARPTSDPEPATGPP
jgi:fermentation-respiration switch protein FrsA (DUF1100 family)